ncbi:BatA domain-containing protein [Thalassoroseus pseudoceratinae]|uniref:BatA domain-containing protein n=1 Tax=Thalassoroseus pseudoceratinae TaxID=2713176 RepID=UPI00141F86E1|nr:BatA domain-containing protein [Thalassoroseus pseudoceratinae]
MSFLSIAFLTALPLALAPVLLHLFDRRRNVVIEWGAMQFLQEAVTRRTSARKLKQWLLLLLRTLAVLALIFALARPLLPGNWFTGTDRGETIFVVDNSLSMMRLAGDDETLFDQAIGKVKAELDDLPPTEFVRVLLSSPYPSWSTTGSLRVDAQSKSHIIDELDELRPTQGQSDLLAALFAATQAEVQPTQQRRRIVLLTDHQATDWNLGVEESWQRYRDVLASTPIPTELEFVNLRESQTGKNVAVNSLAANRTTVGVDRPFTLTAEIQNHSETGISPSLATWTIGQESVYESQIPDLDANAVHTAEWTYSFSEPGVYSISCELDIEDELPQDNTATLVIEVVRQLPVLIVEGAPDRAELQRDAFFVETALGWIDGMPGSANTVYAPTTVEPERLEHLDLAAFHAVVVPNLTELSETSTERLAEFVRSGGGLWIALGPRTDVDAFNQRLYADGNGLAPLRLDQIVDSLDAEESTDRTKINPFMKGHPATASLSDTDQLDLADVAVARRFRFESAPPGEDISMLLGLTNGEPLAVENYFGRGRVVVQTIPLRLQWSDLARSQSFVVIVHDWLDYLTQPLSTRHNLTPGEQLAIRLLDSDVKTATLETPHGNEIELSAESSDGGAVFRTSRTALPGSYRLDTGSENGAIPFHVRRDPQESNLAALTGEQLQSVQSLTDIEPKATEAGEIIEVGTEPLWPFLLMGLIGIIAMELLLSGMISRERFGSDPIAETTEPENQNFGFPPPVDHGATAMGGMPMAPRGHGDFERQTIPTQSGGHATRV